MREAWLRTVQTLQSDLARTQSQISTGQRFTRPSEDPVAATRALQLDGSLQQTQQYASNISLAKSRLGMEESALDKVGDIIQRLRELAVTANNDSQSAETRAAIASEARQQLDALVELANSQDGNGEYLFSGYQTRTRPFTKGPSGVTYNGDQGARQLQIGADRRIADGDNGYGIFMDIRNGNGTFAITPAGANTGAGVVGASSVVNPTAYDADTYTVTFSAPDAYEVFDSGGNSVATGTFAPGQSIAFAGIEFALEGTPAAGDSFTVAPSARQDVFRTVQNFIDALSIGSDTEAASALQHSAIGRSIQELDLVVGNVLDVRATVGSRLNSIDAQEQVNSDLELNLQSLLSELRDLDYADAITRLQQHLTTLQAAQSSYASSQGLSLFNYF